jgi:hypothetical protein
MIILLITFTAGVLTGIFFYHNNVAKVSKKSEEAKKFFDKK